MHGMQEPTRLGFDATVHEPDGCAGVTLGDLHLDGAAEYVSELRALWEESTGTR